ncbi:MAG: hypothetical protein QXG00_05370 [Candidatus Woesearchaeota archaeon]
MDNNFNYNDLSKYDKENDNSQGVSNLNSGFGYNEKEEMELIPHSEIESIRDQLLEIKKTPFRDPEVDKELIKAMNKLDNSISRLISIFEEANQEISSSANQNQEFLDKLNEIIEQNSKIAEGVLALADMFKSPEPPVIPEQNHENDFNINILSSPNKEKQGVSFANYDDYSKPVVDRTHQDSAFDSALSQHDFSLQTLDMSQYNNESLSSDNQQIEKDPNLSYPGNNWDDQKQFSSSGLFGSNNIPSSITPGDNAFNNIKPIIDRPPEDGFKDFVPPPPIAQQIEKIPLPPEKKGLLSRFRK